MMPRSRAEEEMEVNFRLSRKKWKEDLDRSTFLHHPYPTTCLYPLQHSSTNIEIFARQQENSKCKNDHNHSEFGVPGPRIPILIGRRQVCMYSTLRSTYYEVPSAPPAPAGGIRGSGPRPFGRRGPPRDFEFRSG